MTHCIYWDASAVLPLFVVDIHTEKAKKIYNPENENFLSSLGVAEILGVLSRVTGTYAKISKERFAKSLDDGEWSFCLSVPSVKTIKQLAEKHRLRGADLWHLSVACELQKEISELTLVSFDDLLKKAAEKEGLWKTVKI